MQLLLALVLPMVLLVGLTALLATGSRLSFSRNAAWLLERQSSIWMTGIVALAATAAVVALQR